MTNQHIGSKTDQFPEDEKHDEIAREHDTEHRKHEERQCREIARFPVVISHVAQRIDVNECADPGNQKNHRPAQRVQRQSDRHFECAGDVDPRDLGRIAGRVRENQTTTDKTHEHCDD